jgi:PST family polysaccharide transporter
MLAMKALKGAGWLVGSRFVGRLFDLVTLLVFARLLSPADFGMTALALTFVIVADVVLEVPVTQALTRLPAIDRSHLDTGFTLGLLRGLAIGALVLAAAWPLSVLYDNMQLGPIMAALAVGPMLRGLASPQMVRFVREMSFRRLFLAEVFGKAAAAAAAIATALAGGGYWALVVNSVVGVGAGAAISYVFAPYRPRLSLARFGDFASFIGWFSLAQLVSAVNWQFDRMLLGAHVDKPTLGRYVVASDLSVMPTQSLIGPAMQPVMAAFARIGDDRERLRLAFLKASRFAMAISAPMAIGIALIADLIVALLLGPQWRDAAPLLSLLALSVAAMPYYQTLSSLAVAVDRPAVMFRLNAIDLGLRAVLLPLGMLAASAPGVAAARVALSAIMFFAYLAQARAITGAGLGAQLLNVWKVAAAAGLMAAAVLAARHGLAASPPHALIETAIAVAVGAAAYGAGLLACGMRLSLGQGRFEIVDRW